MSRPIKYTEGRKQLILNLTYDIHTKLKLYSVKHKKSMNEIISEFIDKLKD